MSGKSLQKSPTAHSVHCKNIHRNSAWFIEVGFFVLKEISLDIDNSLAQGCVCPDC